MPEFVCKKTLNIGYIAFYKGKTYKPYDKYNNGFLFNDEYANTHQMNWHEIKETFEIPEEGLDFSIYK